MEVSIDAFVTTASLSQNTLAGPSIGMPNILSLKGSAMICSAAVFMATNSELNVDDSTACCEEYPLCDTLCGSSVETSSPLINTQIRRSIFASTGEPTMESNLIHGDRNALFAMVARRLEAFQVLRTPVLLGLINSVNITVVAQ
eukprot:scaffold575599_cov83-Attheya_sp.AAC.1